MLCTHENMYRPVYKQRLNKINKDIVLIAFYWMFYFKVHVYYNNYRTTWYNRKISKNFGNIKKNLCKKQSLINVNISQVSLIHSEKFHVNKSIPFYWNSALHHKLQNMHIPPSWRKNPNLHLPKLHIHVQG